MYWNRKNLVTVFLVVLALIGGGGISDSNAQDSKNYSFVSSNPGGTWYNMVGGAVSLYNKEIPGVNFSLEATGGSLENVRRVASGEADFGMGYPSHMYDAWNGKGQFRKPSKSIRALCEVTISPHYFVTLKNKKINNVKDLEGKRVSLGAPGSGTASNSANFLKILDVNLDPSFMSFSAAARALQDGKIDALGQGGAPAPGIVELAATQDILIIPYSDEDLTKIIKEIPAYSKGVLPANTYNGQTENVKLPQFHVAMLANENVPDDVVYNVLKATFSDAGKKYLASVHRQWKTIRENKEIFDMVKVPFHPGAERYWKEYSN